MDITVLKDLGLTESEIKTYLALLELGSAHAGPIRVKSQLQNSVTHRALTSLIQKGLINYVMEGRKRLYQATDPETFYAYLDEKKRRFTELLPELKARQHPKPSSQATVYHGARGIHEVYSIMIQQKGEYNTFGGGEQCAQRMGIAWWNNVHKRRSAQKLASRQVFDETVRPHADIIANTPDTKIRYLAAEFAAFQETVIVGDYVAIAVFTEHPYALLIHDPLVADSYRKHFELLWKQAKK